MKPKITTLLPQYFQITAMHSISCVLLSTWYLPFCVVLYIMYISMFVCIYVVSYKLCCFRNKWIELNSVCCCSLPVWRRSSLKKGSPVTYFGPALDPPRDSLWTWARVQTARSTAFSNRCHLIFLICYLYYHFYDLSASYIQYLSRGLFTSSFDYTVFAVSGKVGYT